MADPGEDADAEVQENTEMPDTVQEGSRTRRVKTEEPGKGTYYLDEEDVNPKKRSCTDPICCCLFILGIAGMFYMQYSNSQIAYIFKILYPLDHAGNSCGLGDFKDYPKVYYPSKRILKGGGALTADVYYSNPENLWSVCTKECPHQYSREDRPGMCKEHSHEMTRTHQVVNTTADENGTDLGFNTTATEETVVETQPVCTWYSTMQPKLVLTQYCVFGQSLLHHEPDSTGTVCQSSQKAVEVVQEEAVQSLSNMGNSTKHYLNYLKDNVPEVEQDPEMSEILLKLETDTDTRVLAEKEAVKNAAMNTSETNIVKVCQDAVGEQKSRLSDFVADLVNGWGVLLTSVSLGLITGAIYLCLICYFVKPIVWGSAVLVIIGFGVGGWFFWDEAIQVADTGLVSDPASEEKMLAVLCWLCAAVCLGIVVAFRRGLHLACAISSATSSFLLKNIGVMFVPHILSFVQIGFLCLWLTGLSGILSTAEVKPADNVTQEHDRFVITDTIKVKLAYHTLIGLWIHGYLDGMATVATSMTVTDWYYKPKVKGEKPADHLSCFKDMAKAFLYHSGSVAFGSLVVSVVQVLKLTLYLYEKVIANMTSENVGKYMVACCKCCLSLVERLLKFINFNAYLMVGISGKSFIWSAKDVWGIVTRNPRRFFVFYGVMWTLNLIGRFVIMGVMLLWAALLLNKSIFPSLSESVHSPWHVLITVMVLGYMVAGLVFGVFTTAGASLFYNFVCDEEICSFSGGDKEVHAPGDLGKLLDAEMKRKRRGKKKEKTDGESAKKPLKSADEEAPVAAEVKPGPEF